MQNSGFLRLWSFALRGRSHMVGGAVMNHGKCHLALLAAEHTTVRTPSHKARATILHQQRGIRPYFILMPLGYFSYHWCSRWPSCRTVFHINQRYRASRQPWPPPMSPRLQMATFQPSNADAITPGDRHSTLLSIYSTGLFFLRLVPFGWPWIGGASCVGYGRTFTQQQGCRINHHHQSIIIHTHIHTRARAGGLGGGKYKIQFVGLVERAGRAGAPWII